MYMNHIMRIVLGIASFSFFHVMAFHQTDFAYTNNYYGATARETVSAHPITTRLGLVGVTARDIHLTLKGRIRQEGCSFDKVLTLRDDFNDSYKFARFKFNLDLHAQYGKQTYKKVAAELFTRMTVCSIWDEAYAYTPLLEEKVKINPESFRKSAELSRHTHKGVTPLLYLEEGYMKLHLDTFFPLPFGFSLQVGHFPFMVGRGVSLGDYFDGAIEYLGWKRRGDPGNATQRPAGLLLRADLSSSCAIEGYYTPWRKRTHHPYVVREEVRDKRLDINHDDPAQLQRGAHADRDLYALRARYKYLLSPTQHAYVEPYVVYVDEPELEVEYKADASAQLATWGMMVEYSNHNFTCNIECAVQTGTHTMHPIDRNHLVIDDMYYKEQSHSFLPIGGYGTLGGGGRLDEHIGIPAKYHSHILIGVKKAPDTQDFLPYRAYYVSDEIEHINRDRQVAAQGEQIKDEKGNVYISGKFSTSTGKHLYNAYRFKTDIPYYDVTLGLTDTAPDGTLYNADIPFGGMRRFRKGYTRTFAGNMFMIDMSYLSTDKTLRIGAAAAYMSGDVYPFNKEEDGIYKGFIPLRDANYVGRSVTSFGILYARKLPFPTTFSDVQLYAPNESESMSGITYVGMSAQYSPASCDRTLMIEGNVLCFWKSIPLFKWDQTLQRQFGSEKYNDLYKHAQEKLFHFKGHTTDQEASRCLGYECNTVIKYKPFSHLELALRAAVFIPGPLYTDIKGMPNSNTIRQDSDGELWFEGLGTCTAYGVQVRATFKF